MMELSGTLKQYQKNGPTSSYRLIWNRYENKTSSKKKKKEDIKDNETENTVNETFYRNSQDGSKSRIELTGESVNI